MKQLQKKIKILKNIFLYNYECVNSVGNANCRPGCT